VILSFTSWYIIQTTAISLFYIVYICIQQLVGKFGLTSALRKELLAAIENHPIQLELHMANDLSVLTENGCDLSFDYVCLCLDFKTTSAVPGDIDFLKTQLNQLDKNYSAVRMCFVG
jgi:hypothetical protein